MDTKFVKPQKIHLPKHKKFQITHKKKNVIKVP